MISNSSLGLAVAAAMLVAAALLVVFFTRVHWHRWSHWELVERGRLTRVKRGDEFIAGSFLQQERKCHDCGKIEMHLETNLIPVDDQWL